MFCFVKGFFVFWFFVCFFFGGGGVVSLYVLILVDYTKFMKMKEKNFIVFCFVCFVLFLVDYILWS